MSVLDSSVLSDPEILDDLAGLILKRLDAPRAKSEEPIPPLLCEIDGTNKSGKNTTIVEIDRWFRRRKFNVRLQEESAEIPWVRAASAQNSYTYQMSHFAHEFSNFLQASNDRQAHLFLANRNIVDNLYWMESHFRLGKISKSERDEFRSFILGGPWMQMIDTLAFLITDPETALAREYGNSGNVIYGSKMNPEKLELLFDCTRTVINDLTAKYPELPVIKIDTAQFSISEVRDRIVSFLLRSAMRRLNVADDDLLPHSVNLLRRKAFLVGPEIKMRGTKSDSVLRDCGWELETAISQKDTYLLPRNVKMEQKEYLRIRETGNQWCHFGYKRSEPDSRRRMRLNIPMPVERVREFLSEMQVIAIIEKDREIFTKDGILLHRDYLKDIGLYTELYGTKTMQEADLLEQAILLGFADSDQVFTSYLGLYLEKHKK